MAAEDLPALPERTERPYRRQVRILQQGRPERTNVMTEPRRTAKTAAAPVIALFEFPQFELPKFELPNVEMPAALREIAEQGIAQAQAAYERAKAAAEQATGVLERSYAAASEGAAEYNRQVLGAGGAHG